MHRLLILTVMTLCFAGGLVAPALATDYCAPLSLQTGLTCICTVWNYADKVDNDVVIEISYMTPEGVQTDIHGPLNIQPGRFSAWTYTHTYDSGSICGCKVTGEGGLTRTSLIVANELIPLAVVPCGKM